MKKFIFRLATVFLVGCMMPIWGMNDLGQAREEALGALGQNMDYDNPGYHARNVFNSTHQVNGAHQNIASQQHIINQQHINNRTGISYQDSWSSVGSYALRQLALELIVKLGAEVVIGGGGLVLSNWVVPAIMRRYSPWMQVGENMKVMNETLSLQYKVLSDDVFDSSDIAGEVIKRYEKRLNALGRMILLKIEDIDPLMRAECAAKYYTQVRNFKEIVEEINEKYYFSSEEDIFERHRQKSRDCFDEKLIKPDFEALKTIHYLIMQKIEGSWEKNVVNIMPRNVLTDALLEPYKRMGQCFLSRQDSPQTLPLESALNSNAGDGSESDNELQQDECIDRKSLMSNSYDDVEIELNNILNSRKR